MTKEELKQEAEEWIKDHSGLIGSYEFVKYDYDSMQKAYLASAEPREKRIAELEKENTELKCECRRCVYTDCPCVLSDYGKDRNGICSHFKDVFTENAALKRQLEEADNATDCFNRQEEIIAKAIEALKSISKLASSLYASGYSSKKIAERIQDKIEQFLNSEVEK